MAAGKVKDVLGLIEKDDDFQEFPCQEWTARKEDKKDLNVWQSNWTTDLNSEFSTKLRQELIKGGLLKTTMEGK